MRLKICCGIGKLLNDGALGYYRQIVITKKQVFGEKTRQYYLRSFNINTYCFIIIESHANTAEWNFGGGAVHVMRSILSSGFQEKNTDLRVTMSLYNTLWNCLWKYSIIARFFPFVFEKISFAKFLAALHTIGVQWLLH